MSANFDSLLTATYTSTTEGEAILKQLTRSGGFSSENVFARLALARSLKDPPIEWAEELDQNLVGKQIRGQTLLGRQEIAVPLVAIVCEVHRAERPSIDDLRRLIRLHWDRGLRLLKADLGQQSVDDLLLSYAAEVLAEESGSSTGALVSPSSVVQELIVGQQQLKKYLSPMLALASASTPPRLERAIGFVAPPGFGKRHIARAVATSLQLPLVELPASDLKSGFIPAVRSRLSEQGYLLPAIKDVVQLPACVLFISEAELLTAGDHRVLTSLASGSRAVRIDGGLVRLTGGGVIIGGQAFPRDKKRSDLALESYSRDEIAEVIKRSVGSWPLEVRRHLSLAGRLVPHDALVLAGEFRDAIRSRGNNSRPSETLLLTLMREKWGLDRLGLGQSDYTTLGRIAKNQVVISDLSLRDVFFFSRLGLVRQLRQSVELTSRGREALEAWEGIR